MCGIVGVFDRAGRPFDRDRLVAMRDTMTHRGPDDAAAWYRPERGDVALGHRRLSIVDLSPAGRQPMENEDGTVQIVFNGEIYNHEALRPRLEAAGHQFRSRCDTEVLIHLWEEEGPAMLDHLVGMFAIAIWDERKQELFCARDRLGIKPLYFVDAGGTFAFASEIKALLPLVPRNEVDPVALRDYLTFVAVPPPRTLFAGVSKLAPGCHMTVTRDGHGPQISWWDPLRNRARWDEPSEVDWVSEVRFRLRRSVERRMMSDVPVGVFLSGGVDSSTNVAIMSELISDPVRTFSIGFEGTERYNEFDWARRVAKQFGTEHHETTISHDDLWGFLPKLVHHQDEPIADPVCVPLYFVSQLAKREGVTVVHVGEGADELFAGYPTYVQAYEATTGPWARLRSLPFPLQRALAAGGRLALRGRPGYALHREALGRLAQRDGRLWWGGAVAFYEDGLEAVTTPALHRAAGQAELPRDVVRSIAEVADREGASTLDSLIYQDLRLRLPELLLMRVDKLTMANAIEARVPFLDHELVELAMSMPASEKIRDGIGKHIVKRAVSDLLPHDLLWRPKQGFGTPVSEWFRGPLGERLDAALKTSAIHDLGFLDRQGIQDTLDLHRSGRAERSFQLWNILNLCQWFDHWIAGDPLDA
jgi:asparagine synthase (glutamine-hydrolysing)